MYLGIDTSNYTTSVAGYDGENIIQKKIPLPVKQGQKGLRQSDAVFLHTVNLPRVLDKFFDKKYDVDALGVSVSPTTEENSYMPCFLTGIASAVSISKALDVPLYRFSHQQGHIAAALYGTKKLEFINEEFFAFHISGGTTDLLFVEPDDINILSIKRIGGTTDLKAGQAVDRLGVNLGFPFPAGKYVDAEALKSDKTFKIKPTVNGLDCSLSGLQNKYEKMISDGEAVEDICKFCIDYLSETILKLIDNAIKIYGKKPIVMSGGVMSNSIIKSRVSAQTGAFFAPPEFSADNAAGIAVLTKLKGERL